MKKLMKNKIILLIAVLALVLAVGIGGTVAFLIDRSGPVENVFAPAKVTCAVSESFDGTTKDEVKIENTGDTNAFIRATVVGNWVKVNTENNTKEIIAPWTDDIEYNIGDSDDKWIKIGNYYYYTEEVAPEGMTAVLFTRYTEPANKPAGADHLQLTIVCQAIQSKPAAAVTGVWPVTVNADGTLTAKSGS